MLLGAYSYKILSAQEFAPFFQANRHIIFKKDLDINDEAFLSVEEDMQIQELARNMGNPFRLYIGIYHNDEQIGWTFGWQENRCKFYMCNTGILPAHQNKGIYKKLLPEILSILQQEGFQEVYSRHKATNNQVIVPKLQAGFYISKMEISTTFGVLAHLSYFFNENNRKALQFWTGQYRPDEAFKKYIKGIGHE